MTLDHDELDKNVRKVVGILLKPLMILTSVLASYACPYGCRVSTQLSRQNQNRVFTQFLFRTGGH